MFTLSAHRQALGEARALARRDLNLHRQILRAQQDALRRQRDDARRMLQQERACVVEERERIRVAAKEYLVVWARAREDGRRLLRFIQRHPGLLRLAAPHLRREPARRRAA